MATGNPSTGKSNTGQGSAAPETEILNVVMAREGQKVSAKWGLHPKLKEELQPEEWKELTEIMMKVTSIVGNRFSQVLSQAESEGSGNA